MTERTANESPQLRAIASGVSYGALAKDEHARIAVESALKKMRPATIGSVLLFLTTGYAHNPTKAIKYAAKAAGTPQVFGCCAASVLTEEEWLLDGEGAVAMVFPQDHRMQAHIVAQQQGIECSLLLSLSSPNATNIAIHKFDTAKFGSICSDDYGHGPYSLWQNGRIEENEFVHLCFPDETSHSVGVAHGITQVSPIMQINKSAGHVLIEIDEMSASSNLLHSLPENLHAVGQKQPFNLLCAVSENNSLESIDSGHYTLHHVVSTDSEAGKIHLSGSVKSGCHLFWALRDEQQAYLNMQTELDNANRHLGKEPTFALMFPNIGRGPEFYNGRDKDLDAFKQSFPNTPLIGFYGNGEIAPGHKVSGLIHHYSTVFALFA